MDNSTPHEENTQPDVTSDPAENDREGHDWSDEGGATEEGPATSTDPDSGNRGVSTEPDSGNRGYATEPERGDLE
jgi:hypothetical protein